MKVTYDSKAQALYIKLFNTKHGISEELVGDVVILDKTEFGQIYGIEVLGVEKVEDITKK